jgi:hypothetical protein
LPIAADEGWRMMNQESGKGQEDEEDLPYGGFFLFS